MEIGSEAKVSYMGYHDDNHLFTTELFGELIKIPDGKLFGKSVLDVSTRLLLKRNTVSQYTVRVA